MTLNKTAPFFTVLFSWILLGERVSWRQFGHLLLAFAGAALVMKPGFRGGGTFAAAMALTGGLGAGLAYVCVHQLGRMKVNGAFIVLFFSAFSCVASLPLTAIDFRPMTMAQVLILVGAGAGAALGQFGVTALRLRVLFAGPRRAFSRRLCGDPHRGVRHEPERKFMKTIKCALLAAVAMAAPCIHAEESSPVMLSLLNPVQWPSSQCDVGGFRLSLLYGQCDGFAGLDIGLVGCATGDFRGLAVGGANIVSRRLVGLQFGLVNWNSNGDESSTRRSIGVQYGLLNYADSLFGLQDGWLNVSTGDMSGVQWGFLNCACDVSGVQCGALVVFGVNVAVETVSGCQVGIVNYAGRMESGLQIGIVNVIARNGFFPVLPILNGGF